MFAYKSSFQWSHSFNEALNLLPFGKLRNPKVIIEAIIIHDEMQATAEYSKTA